MIDVVEVSVAFDGTPVLHDASLHVARGEIVALIGPSGSGKSTLLRLIAGLILPDQGRVLLEGRDVTRVPTHRRGVGMVFQDNQLFPHRTVSDNVSFGLKMTGMRADPRREQADVWLERVGLGGFGSRRATELSGGEAKRVALARTLIVEPSVVLLDEPLTGLDRDLREQLLDDLSSLLRDTGTTALLVTHDLSEAEALADRTVRIRDITTTPVRNTRTANDKEGT